MKRCVIALVFTLIAMTANAGQITVIPFETNGHSYLMTLYMNKPVGSMHNPDCPNPKHIDNQFQAYLKRNQEKPLPQGHPPITPELKRQLKNKKNEIPI